MTDKKNIETLLQEMKEMELPKGYDQRFHAKLNEAENPMSFLGKFSIFNIPSSVGWAATLGSLFLISFSILRIRKNQNVSDVAINDEIDMLEDLDVLESWNEEENV